MFKSFIKYTFAIICFLSFPLLQAADEPKHLCLTMIVKNESNIIGRCLNSAKDIVDCISICDTGSTDNTIAIIEDFLKTHNIPGKVHQHTWQNFGHNRTLSVQAAQQTLEELGFPLSHTYLLHLDADMILKVAPNFKKEELILDSYTVLQNTPTLAYYNTRLTRSSMPWESKGVTHEYWACKQPITSSVLKTLRIDDHGDGGCKSDKFERDIKLLTQGLKEEPDNCRYMFYLGQSYRCLQQYEDAIRWYKARIEKGDWKEEVWYSKFAVGDCYQHMGLWDQALAWYLDAYEYNPDRAEPLHSIANYYRLKNQHNLAFLFAKQGSKIPYPHHQILFISYPVYNYQFDEELSIVAYYTPFKEEGLVAVDRLLLKANVPKHIKKQANKNLFFYIKNLPHIELQKIESEAYASQINQKEEGDASIFKYEPTYDFVTLHASSVPIAFDDGYLMITHKNVEEPSYDIHRFLYLDKNFTVKKVSQPFTFLHKGIEHCDGMSIDPLSERCLIPFHFENQDRYLLSADLNTIRSLLKPLP